MTDADLSRLFELDMLGLRYHARPFEVFSRAILAADGSFWSHLSIRYKRN